eukprot:TRINITY_DN66285_c6_g1_i1.p1 TRINITY_DN66285_c6_g1~~TRINITY_DN66285_c6_g1_i1.p1  ORF type:complete len:692 (-),score=281.59 TRINITY_DN66285_c6_g1_i1:1053-3128(-)
MTSREAVDSASSQDAAADSDAAPSTSLGDNATPLKLFAELSVEEPSEATATNNNPFGDAPTNGDLFFASAGSKAADSDQQQPLISGPFGGGGTAAAAEVVTNNNPFGDGPSLLGGELPKVSTANDLVISGPFGGGRDASQEPTIDLTNETSSLLPADLSFEQPANTNGADKQQSVVSALCGSGGTTPQHSTSVSFGDGRLFSATGPATADSEAQHDTGATDSPFADSPFADSPFADSPFADSPFASTTKATRFRRVSSGSRRHPRKRRHHAQQPRQLSLGSAEIVFNELQPKDHEQSVARVAPEPKVGASASATIENVRDHDETDESDEGEWGFFESDSEDHDDDDDDDDDDDKKQEQEQPSDGLEEENDNAYEAPSTERPELLRTKSHVEYRAECISALNRKGSVLHRLIVCIDQALAKTKIVPFLTKGEAFLLEEAVMGAAPYENRIGYFALAFSPLAAWVRKSRPNNREERRIEIIAALGTLNLPLRSDSSLCKAYINGINWYTLRETVKKMAQAKYLHTYCNMGAAKAELTGYLCDNEWYIDDDDFRDQINKTALDNTILGRFPKEWPWMHDVTAYTWRSRENALRVAHRRAKNKRMKRADMELYLLGLTTETPMVLRGKYKAKDSLDTLERRVNVRPRRRRRSSAHFFIEFYFDEGFNSCVDDDDFEDDYDDCDDNYDIDNDYYYY